MRASRQSTHRAWGAAARPIKASSAHFQRWGDALRSRKRGKTDRLEAASRQHRAVLVATARSESLIHYMINLNRIRCAHILAAAESAGNKQAPVPTAPAKDDIALRDEYSRTI